MSGRVAFLLLACVCVPAAGATGGAEDTPAAISALVAEGRLDEATSRAAAAVDRVTNGQEPATMELARAIDELTNAGWRARPPREDVRPLAEAVVRLKEDLVGPEDPEVAASLHLLGNLLRALGEWKLAQSQYERALSIREKAFGPDALELTPTLNNLGSITQGLGDLPTSRRYLERCLAIRERRGAPEAKLSPVLLNLGSTLMLLGEYEAAESILERCLAIRERLYGPSSNAVAGVLNNLANVDLRLGRHERAEERYRRVLSILEGLGAGESDKVGILGNLAVLRQEVGDYAEARELQERVVRERERNAEREPAQLALTLNNLGLMLWQTGDWDEAEVHLERALELRRRIHPEGDPDTAMTLNNLSATAWGKGEKERARRLAAEALAMIERSVGQDHREASSALRNLGEYAMEHGDLEEARRLFERALGIDERLVGTEHPDLSAPLVNLGTVLSLAGRHEEAKRTLARAVALREAFDGGGFPLASALVHQARALLAAGETGAALDAALRGEARAREQFRLAARSLSERHALSLVAGRPDGLGPAFAAVSRRPVPADLRRVHDALIRSRALVLDEMLARRRSVHERDDAETAALVRELSEKNRRLAQLLLRGPEKEQPRAHAALVEEAREEAEAAERKLAARSARYRAERTAREAGFAEIRAALPDGAVLVSYALWSNRGPSRYAALVLGPRAASPKLVDLGPASEIDALIRQWHDRASRSGDEAAYRAVAAALRAAVWDPVAEASGGASEFFVVPEGQLHLVNLNALPVGDGRYLVETGLRVHLLSVERDLVSEGKREEEEARSLLALGAPDFDADPRRVAAALPPRAAGGGAASGGAAGGGDAGEGGAVGSDAAVAGGSGVFRDPDSAPCVELGQTRFGRLGSAREEVERIAALWGEGAPVATRVGAAAGEGRFKREAPGHGALHVATHAFFLDHVCGAARTREPDGATEPLKAPYIAATNPLLVSGLALAGANRRAELDVEGAVDDGMLTSAEIAELDLRGVSSVVLSACETGGGDILKGEGVLGLRRAFLAAGAHSVVMSLWRVQDEFTARWMTYYYRALRGEAGQGRSTDDAVRAASLAMLDSLRADGRSTHPFYWGAFVAVGG